ncbi:MAG: ferrous iron transport protein A [Clostridiales bacterium]|nr:ferrous iron transport protein A [Clostridiales bacterium]
MKKIGDKCNLSELKIGQKAIVKKLNFENKEIRRHLLDMGVTRGVQVKVKKIAPMGEPIDLELRGYELALRKSELRNIEVEVVG